MVVIADLTDDWSSKAVPDIYSFVPFTWTVNLIVKQFELITLANEYNWMDTSSHNQENSQCYVCLSTCLPACVSAYMSTCLSVCLFLFFYLVVCLPFSVFCTCLSVCLPVFVFAYLSLFFTSLYLGLSLCFLVFYFSDFLSSLSSPCY